MMDTQEVADLAGIPVATLRSWFKRGHVQRELLEMPEGDGLPSRIGPRTAAQIIAIAALVRIGFTVSAASDLVYREAA